MTSNEKLKMTGKKYVTSSIENVKWKKNRDNFCTDHRSFGTNRVSGNLGKAKQKIWHNSNTNITVIIIIIQYSKEVRCIPAILRFRHYTTLTTTHSNNKQQTLLRRAVVTRSGHRGHRIMFLLVNAHLSVVSH